MVSDIETVQKEQDPLSLDIKALAKNPTHSIVGPQTTQVMCESRQ